MVYAGEKGTGGISVGSEMKPHGPLPPRLSREFESRKVG